MTYQDSETYKSTQKRADAININGIDCANRSWFHLKYMEEAGKIVAPSAAPFDGLEIIADFGKPKYHKVSDYDSYREQMDNLLKKKPKQTKASMVARVDELIRHVDWLESRIEALENKPRVGIFNGK